MASKNYSFYSQIYRHWRIKIYGYSNGRHYNQLAGVPLLIRELGSVLCNKILGQAEYSDLEVITFMFRRGLKVTFYAK